MNEQMSPIRARFGSAMRAAVLTTDSSWGEDLVREYQQNPDIRFVNQTSNEETLNNVVAKLGVNLVLVDHGLAGNETGLAVAERIARQFPKIGVYLASTESEQALISLHHTAVTRGIRSAISRPFSPEALVTVVSSVLAHEQTMQEALQVRAGSAPPRVQVIAAPSTLLAVCSGKGGTGKSQVSSNLATLTATCPSSHIPTCLVDVERYSGTTHLLLGPTVQEKARLSDWFALAPKDGGTVDPGDVLRSLVQELPSGLRVVGSPASIEDHDEIPPALMTTVLNSLRLMHTVTIVDLPAEVTGPLLTTVSMATRILVVTNLDKATLRKTRDFLHELQRRGVDLSKAWALFNRVQKYNAITIQDASNVLAGLVTCCGTELPDDPEVQRTRDIDQPTVLESPDCPWSQALRRVAPDILPGLGLELSTLDSKRHKRRHKLFGLF